MQIDEEMMAKIGKSPMVLVVESFNRKTGLGSRFGSQLSGALFLSFLAQFDIYAKSDPGIFPTQLVAIVKGLILGYMLTGLYLAIQANSAE